MKSADSDGLHLDDLPFGWGCAGQQEDLVAAMAEQVGRLARIILWIRATHDAGLFDEDGADIRRMSPSDLVGGFSKTAAYERAVRENMHGYDPLDLSAFLAKAVRVHACRMAAKSQEKGQ